MKQSISDLSWKRRKRKCWLTLLMLSIILVENYIEKDKEDKN